MVHKQKLRDGTMTEQKATGPLAGIRIVDLTQFVLGPYATQTLGDLGADVIKVEEPGGDRNRRGTGKTAPAPDMAALFVEINRNKRSVVMDLKAEEGRAQLRKLIATADVLIHNMRPASIARLGFDYETVKAIKPDIVYVVAMGFGSGGPYSGLQAFDDLIQGASGACDLLTYYDGDPALRPIPSIVADKTCGLFAVIATQAALVHRARTGEGQYVEVPMLETFTGFILAEHLNGQTYVPSRGKYGHPTTITPHRRPMRTKDGWIIVLPNSQDSARRFIEMGGIPDPYNSPRYLAAEGKGRVDTYYAMLNEAAATKTTEEWMQICAEASIPAMRANRLEEVFDDPHFKATGFFEERDLPGGLGRYRAMKPGLKFEKTPCEIRYDPPRIGQDTEEVLAEIATRQAG
jgi:crotonobetainyl-CoA:carnitine CoA-transferase CaiB-like acyl-CoA transferase